MIIIIAVIIITNTDDLQWGLKIVAKTKSDKKCNGNETNYTVH